MSLHIPDLVVDMSVLGSVIVSVLVEMSVLNLQLVHRSVDHL